MGHCYNRGRRWLCIHRLCKSLTDYVTAESKAEEEARLAKEEAERQGGSRCSERRQNRNLPRARHLRTVQALPAVHQLLMRHRVDPMVRQLQAMQASLLVTHMFMVDPVDERYRLFRICNVCICCIWYQSSTFFQWTEKCRI